MHSSFAACGLWLEFTENNLLSNLGTAMRAV
jgi:hypothetical protein